MEKQGLGLSVEWIENATPQAKEEAQAFVRDFTKLFEEKHAYLQIPAVIERITIKRLHA